MRKKIALLVALMMMILTLAPAVHAEEFVFPYDVNIVTVEGTDTQAALVAHIKEIIEVDGLKFKDLNGNGALDVYEDWRADIDSRVDDLISQMTTREKVAQLFHASTWGAFAPLYPWTEEQLFSNEPSINVDGKVYIPMYYAIVEQGLTNFLHNTGGMPEEQVIQNNYFQEIGESTRLGIPITLSQDRQYNTWGSMIDAPHYAFGTSHDPELVYQLVSQYAKEMRALGYHVLLHGYGVEIGAWYGDEVNYISEMAVAETKAMEENNIASCTKHFIARGGRSNFQNARSAAQLWQNYMVGWKAVIDEAQPSWIMTNNETGLNNDVRVYFSTETLGYLRNELGYDGVVLTDWTLIPNIKKMTSIVTDEGEDLTNADPGIWYINMLEAGVDQFGDWGVTWSPDPNETPIFNSINYPGLLLNYVEDGTCPIELIDTAAARGLRFKFELGLFENPYSDINEVYAVACSDEYIAEQWTPTDIASVYAARNANTNALEEQLQSKAAVLLKNDNILPLQAGTKVYVGGASAEIITLDSEAIAGHTEVVATMEDADVVVARVTAMNDNTELIIEDAKAAGKPVVLVYEGGVSNEPNAYAVENCAAILFQVYQVGADHGASLGNFFKYTRPDITADMLFGVRQPEGSLVFEIAHNAQDALLDWSDLQLDTGVDMATRLFMAATVRQAPDTQFPNNLGDVLYPNGFGMRYDAAADIDLNTLVADQEVAQVEQEVRGSIRMTDVAINKVAKVGEPYTLYLIAENAGADGHVTVEAYEADKLLASKFVSVEGGSFAVVQLDVVFDTAGEHTVTVEDMAITITAE